MKDSAVEVLTAKAKEIKLRDNFVIRTRVIAGKIVDAILDTATNEQADLIVIGNVVRSGISKIRTLGSVSRGVSERATCPVMIVH